MDCSTHEQIYQAIIAIGVGAHALTLFVDYWIGIAGKIESNSIVELIIRSIASHFRKKIAIIDVKKNGSNL